MRILVKADVPGWAFSRRAECYRKYHPEGWEVDVAYSQDHPSGKYDGVLLLDCTASSEGYGNAKVVKMVGSHAWFFEKDPDDPRTLGVNPNRCRSKFKEAIHDCHVAVYNKWQKEQAEEILEREVYLAPYSVDLEVFSPQKRIRREKTVVGWNYQVSGGMNSFKGLSENLIPTIARIGDLVHWRVLTTDPWNCLSTEELIEWYASIDLFLCTSFEEGGPQGPFEAAATGAIVVATNVGQIRDYGDCFMTIREEGPTVDWLERKIRIFSEQKSGRKALLDEGSECHSYMIKHNLDASKVCPMQLEEMFG